MRNFTFKYQVLLLVAVLIGFTTACKKKEDDPAPSESTPGYRTTKIDYSTLTATTSYRTAFLNDEKTDSTVNRNEGRNRLRMFRALAAYVSSASTATIDSAKLSDMFANKNAPFTGIYADLNNLDISIKDVTASSQINPTKVHDDLEYAFGRMAYISTKNAQTAIKGTAGKNGTYLVDEAGIEWGQIIQKSLIGAYHLDYISNVLLNTGLNADNQYLVPGKKYTALEHTWDEAYGFLSMNDIYGSKEVFADPTADPPVAARSGEFYLGSYAWEYNKTGYVKLHTAFLRGRAAIHNNDMTEVRAQAAIIRDILEKAIGGAAEGYMYKSSVASATEASRVHAFGEGLGFVYSTRFCVLSGGDNAFANSLKNGLITTATPTFYDITATQYTAARTAIMAKFGLVIIH